MSGTVHMGRRLAAGSVVTVAVAIAGAGWFVERRVTHLVRERHASDLRAIAEFGARRATAESFGPRLGATDPEDGIPTIEAPTEGGVDGRRVQWLVRNQETGETLGRSPGFPNVQLLADAARGTIELDDASTGKPHRIVGVSLDGAAFDAPLPPRRFDGPGRRGPDRGERDRGRPDFDGPGPGGSATGGRARGGPPRARPPRPSHLPPEARDLSFEIFAAVDISSERELVEVLRGALVLCGAGAAFAAGLLLWLNVRLGMRPVGALADQIEGLRLDGLGAPIDLERDTVELRPIVAALRTNRASLARAFDRQRRFTADAAHELRTPLAGLRASLEVALRRERSVAKHREIAEECLDVTRSMEHAVEALLLLAREESPDPSDAAEVRLTEAVARALEVHAQALDERNITVAVDEPGPPSTVLTHPALLDRVLDNLVSNAAAYAMPGSTARVTVSEESGVHVLEFTNECAALPDDAAERAQEPFWRADAARTTGHVGLGLAIADSAARALGGALLLKSEANDKGSTFSARLELPAA